ncbi:MAG: tRNA (pseudouridine(54)-N(1))-methyltransferase TrmY [Polyangiaceae bacterium]|nr:tRNA (pseudouridine(54)-N(1))-methyltransferase TrmY [Polyangiaceae bacterium]
MRRFVVVGRTARSTPEFKLQDLPGTSGRLDVLVRCVRAALLCSHTIRDDTVVYLVMLGGPPRALRIDGALAQYVRPDERNLAVLVQKSLARVTDREGFVELRQGIAVAQGGLDVVLSDLGPATPYVLDEGGLDVRDAALSLADPVFFCGDHLGLDDAARATLAPLAPGPLSVGPVSVHAEDALTLVINELDRRRAKFR